MYVIPILMALLSVAMGFLAVQSWRQHFWGKARRFYYSLTAGVAITYTLFLAATGQLTVFFLRRDRASTASITLTIRHQES